jgi:hypothetical protein
VTKVEYVVSPVLVRKFNEAKAALEERARKENGDNSDAAAAAGNSSKSKVQAAPVLGFHGTDTKAWHCFVVGFSWLF